MFVRRIALVFVVAIFVSGCTKSAEIDPVAEKLAGAWLADFQAPSGEKIHLRLVTELDRNGTFYSHFRSTNKEGVVERSWERGKWSLVGKEVVRHETIESTDGKPKQHESVYDFRIVFLNEDKLHWKGSSPDSYTIEMVRVERGTQP